MDELTFENFKGKVNENKQEFYKIFEKNINLLNKTNYEKYLLLEIVT